MKINWENIKQKGQSISLIAVGIFLIMFAAFFIARGIFSVWTRISIILIVVSLAAAVYLNFDAIKNIFKKSGTVTGIARVGQFVVITAILVFLYLLSDLIPWRSDLTSSRLYSLSDQSRSLIRQVTNDFDIYVFWDKSFMSSDVVYHLSDYQKNLLRAYADKNPHMKIHEIDPILNAEMTEKYNIENPGTVVFEYNGNRVKIPFKSISEINQGSGDIIYKGEIEFTGALKTLLASKPKIVYVLRGHGEMHPGTQHEFGHSKIFQMLQDDNVKVMSLDLLKMREIPHDCGALIIANPEKPILPENLDKIKMYMQEGGNVLVMLEFKANYLVNDILKEMGLFFEPNMIVEDEMYSENRITLVPIILSFKDITTPLLKSSLQLYMPTAVGIAQLPEQFLNPAFNYIVTPLLRSSEFSYGEMSQDQVSKGKIIQDKDDAKGPLYPAFAVKRLELDIITNADSITTNITESRMVAIGDIDFINNVNYMKYGNSDFFMNSLNFLLRREQNVTTRPKINVDAPIIVSSLAKRLFLIFTILLVFGYLSTGIVRVVRRRQKVKD